jgi:GMP synthase-like glutamine amidotransferase
MYKDQNIYRSLKIKKKLLYGLEGNKVIFKKWDDAAGIQYILKNKKVCGIVITGSDYFIGEGVHSVIDESILKSKIPILAICYGFQYLISKYRKLSFIKSCKSGYMKYYNSFSITHPFYIPKNKYFFSHTDYIVKVPKNYKIIKRIGEKIIVAYNYKKNILCTQFHPEKYKKSSRIFFNTWIAKCLLY